MKDESKRQSLFAKINQLIIGKDEEKEKDDCKVSAQAQQIYGQLRDAYQRMKNEATGLDYYEYNPKTDVGIYIRNTSRPSFAMTLQWGFKDYDGFWEFCEENICKPCMDRDPDVSILEFYWGVPDKACPNAIRRLRYNFILADELKFIDHGLEGCTQAFCRAALKEQKN